jgi:hypothetical protein
MGACLFAAVGLATGDDDTRTLLDENLGQFTTESGRRAEDECALSGELQIHAQLPNHTVRITV